MSDKELRTLNISDLEVRDANSDNFIGMIGGYAVIFDQPSENLGGFIEYIKPDAFDGVDLGDVLALYNHDFGSLLGRSSAGTLKLNIDKRGLYFSLAIPDTTLGRDVYTNIKAGNLRGMSFGFTVTDDEWQQSDDGVPLRFISRFDELYEVSVVGMPAYKETTVSVTRNINRLKANNYKAKALAILQTYE